MINCAIAGLGRWGRALVEASASCGRLDVTRAVSTGQDSPMIVQSAGSFDPIAIQPDSDVCYKIRAYIFSTGSHPRLIRETTCGPRRPSAKKIDKPEFLPLGVKTKPGEAPEK